MDNRYCTFLKFCRKHVLWQELEDAPNPPAMMTQKGGFQFLDVSDFPALSFYKRVVRHPTPAEIEISVFCPSKVVSVNK